MTFYRREQYFLFALLALSFFCPAFGWAQAVRGMAGDLWADKILGQFDFSEIKFNEATSQNLFNPTSTIVDTTNNRLYIWDSGNNRILGISNIGLATTSGLSADIVLGQNSVTATGCNHDSNFQTAPNPVLPTDNCLCGEYYGGQSPAEGWSAANMAMDSQGDLYVPDYFNNRILRFDASSISPGSMGVAASDVWGQPDFNSEAPNNIGSNTSGGPTATNLNFAGPHTGWIYAAGVAVDPWGNLWVADYYNSRVLRYPNSTGTVGAHPAHTPDVVLGQAGFNTANPPSPLTVTNLNGLLGPIAVRVDAGGNVYVLENTAYYTRITVFQPTGTNGSGVPTYTNGEPAVTEISSFTSPTPLTQTSFGYAVGLELDPTVIFPMVGLWVTDATNYAFQFLINTSSSYSYTVPKAVGVGSDRGADGLDASGNFYSTGYAGMSVYRFPKPPNGVDYSFDIEPLLPPAGAGYTTPNKIGDIGFFYSGAVAVGAWGGVTQIFGGDGLRIHYWNMPAAGPGGLVNGQPEDGYAGTSTPYTYNALGFGEMAADKVGHLWAAWASPKLVVAVYNLPLTAPPGVEATPIATIGPILSVLGVGASVTWTGLSGMTVDDTGNLWVSDQGDNRVLRVRTPLTAPMVDIILGQTGAGTTFCNGTGTGAPCSSTNPTASTLNYPGHLKFDHHGDLYVSDHSLESNGNLRMLRWDAKTIPAAGSFSTCQFAIPADGVYGTAGSFTAYRPCVDGYPCPNPNNQDEAYWEMAFTSDDSVMVAGTDGQISGYPPIVLQNPRNGIMPVGTPDIPGAGDNPVTHLKDFGPQSFALTFDDQDNLYVTEHNRNRILIYLKPFATPFSTSTSTPTPTPNCCLGVSSLVGQGAGFSAPSGMAIHYGLGLVYITDLGHHQIQVFTTAGVPVASFGSAQLSGPDDVAVDPPGNIFVADYNNGGIYEYNSSYSYVGVFGGGIVGNARGICEDNQGVTESIYVASQNGNLYRFDSISGSVFSSALTFGGGLSAPTGIVKSGNFIYVSNTSGGNIIKYDASSGYSVAATYAAYGGPYGIKTDLAGDFYLTSPSGLVVLNPNFSMNHSCAIPNFPWASVVNMAGQVFLSEYSGNAVTIVQGCQVEPTLTPTGTWTTSTSTPTPTNSPTNTPLLTLTNSPTITPTPTPTSSPTITPTPSPTLTATNSPSPSPTATPTNSPTLTPTFTPSNSPTVTPTSTIAMTPTEGCHDPRVYPNPSKGVDPIHLHFPPCSEGQHAHVRIYTLASRRIFDQDIPQVPLGVDIALEMKDNWGTPLANGLYYLVVEIPQGRKIQKLLILR